MEVPMEKNELYQFLETVKNNTNSYYNKLSITADLLVEQLQVAKRDTESSKDFKQGDIDGLVNEIATGYTEPDRFELVKEIVNNFFQGSNFFASVRPIDGAEYPDGHVFQLLNALAPDTPSIAERFSLGGGVILSRQFLCLGMRGTYTPLFFSEKESVEGFVRLQYSMDSMLSWNGGNLAIRYQLDDGSPPTFEVDLGGEGAKKLYPMLMKTQPLLRPQPNLETPEGGGVEGEVKKNDATVFCFEFIRGNPSEWKKVQVPLTVSPSNEILDVNKKWYRYNNALSKMNLADWEPKHAYMAHLVLLDLSRFGWAPVGSTPLQYDPNFNNVRQSASKAHWKATTRLLTEDYAFSRRLERIKDAFRIEDGQFEEERWTERFGPPDDTKLQAAIERLNNRLAKDPNYDVGAIAMTFAAISIQFNRRFNSLPHLKMDTLENIQRFQLLALKTIATPTEVALQHARVRWQSDINWIGTVFRNSVSVSRDAIEGTDYAHAAACNAVVNRAYDKGRNPLRVGAPCAAVLQGFDDPRICARVRLRCASAEDAEKLSEFFKQHADKIKRKFMSSQDARDFLQASEAGGKCTKLEADAMAKFVANFVRKSVESRASEDAYEKYKHDNFPPQAVELFDAPIVKLSRVLQQKFKSDVLFDILFDNVGKQFSMSVRESTCVHRTKNDVQTRINGWTLVLEEATPFVFTDSKYHEVVLLTKFDITNLQRGSESGFPAGPMDFELDDVLRALRNRFPPHTPPKVSFQTSVREQLREAPPFTIRRVDVWAGPDFGDPATLAEAKAVAPSLPYALTREQFESNQETPFSKSLRVREKLDDVLTQTDAYLQEVKDSLEQYESGATPSDLFHDEVRLDLTPADSIGRLCRIALEVLKGTKPLTTYNNIKGFYHGDESEVSMEDDTLRVQVPLNRDGYLDKEVAIWLQRSMLPPYVYPPEQMIDSSERPEPNESDIVDLVAITWYMVGIYRALMNRLTTYVVPRLQSWHEKTETTYRLKHLIEEYQKIYLEAARFQLMPTHSMTDALPNRPDMKILHRFFFPSSFNQGRIKDDDQSAFHTAKDDTIQLHKTVSDRYLSSAIIQFQAMQTSLPINAAHELILELAHEMALIADGMRLADPFLVKISKASKLIKETKRRQYVEATVIRIRSALQGELTSLEKDHAKFETALYSYNDAVSAQVSTDFQSRFLAALDLAASFRRRITTGFFGSFVFLVFEFFDVVSSGILLENDRVEIQEMYEAIRRITTSKLLTSTPNEAVKAVFEQSPVVAEDDTKTNVTFPHLAEHTSQSVRTHTDFLMGSMLAAAPFRNVPDSMENNRNTDEILHAKQFDTFGGLSNPKALFHCLLPVASELLQNGVEEKCVPDPPPSTKANPGQQAGNKGGSLPGVTPGANGDEDDDDELGEYREVVDEEGSSDGENGYVDIDGFMQSDEDD